MKTYEECTYSHVFKHASQNLMAAMKVASCLSLSTVIMEVSG